MNIYYFTFGIAHTFAKFVQPILAPTKLEAEKIMHRAFGSDWAFSYDDKPEGFQELRILKYLERTVITKEEENIIIKRLNEILSSTGKLRTERLKNLMFDIDCAFDKKNDTRAKEYYDRASDELLNSLRGVS